MVTVHELKDPEIDKAIQTAIEKVKDKVPPHLIPMMKETLLKMELEHLTPREAMKIPEEVIEEMYAQGYFFFQSGKYKDALTFFNVLDQLVSGTDPRFQFAIAATHHQMKDYAAAAGYYMFYATLHPGDPLPYFYLYDCFKKQNNLEFAVNALKKGAELAEKTPKYASLVAKIELELKNIKSL